MKFGLIARSEDRGLGNQTYEIARAMRPDRVLLVDMGDLAGGFPAHPERYADLGLNVTIVSHSELGQWRAMRPWLSGLDVVYSAETFYYPQFIDFANAEGVRTVCHLNPEFYKHGHEPTWTRPTAWWLPSQWLQGDARLPVDAEYVPMPAPTWRWPEAFTTEREPGPTRFLHVSGKPAMGDRNGMRVLFQGLRHVTSQIHMTVRVQGASIPHPARLPRSVRYSAIPGNAKDYASMYRGFDVLVLPRRYGGLCLPVIEAAAAGLAVVMTDCSPNDEYPAHLVPPDEREPFEMLATPLDMLPAYNASPVKLGEAMSSLSNPETLASLRVRSEMWADRMSWDEQADVWAIKLANICSD